MEDAQITEKQNLLKAEILDKNYDKDEFLKFCLEKKENGEDLNNWTLEELHQIVAEFTQLNNQENIKNEIAEIKISNKQAEETPSKTIQIVCKKLEKTPLNDKEIHVIIQNPKPVETGFLSSNYVNYEVKTEVLEWLVRRRYSDFEWLRATLVKYNPGHVIPPMPNKKMGSRRFEVDFIEKRMAFLQKFIDSVVDSEILKASEPLVAFLSMSDRGQFESKMKELSSYQPSPYIEDFRTFSGTITISSEDEEENEKYFVNISKYFTIQSNLFERLNYFLKNFHKNIAEASSNLDDVQKCFESLCLVNTKVLMREQITKTYEELGNFVKNWKKILVKQNEAIKLHVKNFFKFIRMEGTSYAELIRNRDEIRDKYLSEKARLTAKKEKLWQDKLIKKK